MKSLLKKGLVVLFASMFVSSVFAAEMAATGVEQTKPVVHKTAKHHVKKHCKKVHGKKHCKKMKKHYKKAVKTAQAPAAEHAAAPAAAANANSKTQG